jgi:flavin-dependent dehydrogenase
MGYTSGVFDRVFYVRWASSPTAADLATLGPELERACERAKQPLSYLTVVPSDAPVPSSEERAGLEAFAGRIRPWVEHAYLVLEGEGFKASIQRSVIIGLTFFKERGYTTIFKTVDEALRRIASRTGADYNTLVAAARGNTLVR